MRGGHIVGTGGIMAGAPPPPTPTCMHWRLPRVCRRPSTPACSPALRQQACRCMCMPDGVLPPPPPLACATSGAGVHRRPGGHRQAGRDSVVADGWARALADMASSCLVAAACRDVPSPSPSPQVPTAHLLASPPRVPLQSHGARQSEAGRPPAGVHAHWQPGGPRLPWGPCRPQPTLPSATGRPPELRAALQAGPAAAAGWPSCSGRFYA